jgi:hypothetical protein
MQTTFLAIIAATAAAVNIEQQHFQPTVLPSITSTSAPSFSSSNKTYNNLASWDVAPQGLVGGQSDVQSLLDRARSQIQQTAQNIRPLDLSAADQIWRAQTQQPNLGVAAQNFLGAAQNFD